MADQGGKDELNRRLEQTRRMTHDALDPLTKERLKSLAVELEQQLTDVDPENGEAPPK